ncbi:MAG: sugar phosphate isomerase/epimerase [Planctomycetota bacterium]|nr:sugar phosphate isomerase/epimerase [Planctomycetota bacterium]
MQLAVVTNEIAQDLARALAVARDLGLGAVEVGSIWNRELAELDSGELARAEALLNEAGLPVVSVDTHAFKNLPLDGLAHPREHADWARDLEHVRRACELARRWNAPAVRVFSFYKTGMVKYGNPSPRLPEGGPIPAAVLDLVVAGLREAAGIAAQAGVTLLVENVRSNWGNSCANLAKILAAANHPALKAIWDPANDFVSGGTVYPEGYEAQKPWMAHVHLKNAELLDPATGLTRWQRIGAGALDYRVLLSRLRDDGYAGPLVLETHWRGEGLDSEESSRQSFADLARILRDLRAS